MNTAQEQSQRFLNSLDPDSRSMIYQSIQELAQLLNAEASALIYNRISDDEENTWSLVMRLTSGELQIEAESTGPDFSQTLQNLKQKMILTILEVHSQNESPQERSKKVALMANEGFRYTLH